MTMKTSSETRSLPTCLVQKDLAEAVVTMNAGHQHRMSLCVIGSPFRATLGLTKLTLLCLAGTATATPAPFRG
jgi:hypothetical protein